MSVAVVDRPAEVGGRGDGGAPARRAVVRWGWRLFCREWRRHVLIMAMLTVAVAATIVGLGIATNATKLNADPAFGTANTIISLEGTDPHLKADLDALRAKVGPIDVVAHQQIAVPGSVAPVDLRDQIPGGTFTAMTLRLDSGRYPSGPGEVAVTDGTAKQFSLTLGGKWSAVGTSWTVVGIVENPLNFLDEFALVAAGQIPAPKNVSIFTSWQPGPGNRLGLELNGGINSRSQPNPAAVDALVLALGTIGLLFVGLMAVAGFTVLAQRRQRSLGMLASLGATERHLRLVLLADGSAVGLLGGAAGAMVGIGGWFAFVPTLQSIVGHRIDRLAMPWWAVGATVALAVLTAVSAAWWPARAVARTSVIAALSGRPTPPRPAHRLAVAGAALLAGGLALLFFSNHGTPDNRPSFIILGTLITPVSLLFLAPLAIRLLAAVAHRVGVSTRLALRDLARYQARSGAALGSVTLAIAIAATIAISASASHAPNPAGNLSSDQVMVYASANPDTFQVPPLSPSQLQDVTTRLDQLGHAIAARDIVPLEQAYDPQAGLQPPQPGPGGQTVPAGYGTSSLAQVIVHQNGNGIEISGMTPLYVATPALLARYGIAASAIASTTDVVSARTDLAGTTIFTPPSAGPPSPQPGRPASAGRVAPGDSQITPHIQNFPQLPLAGSAPGTLLTTSALQRFGLVAVPAAWLIETTSQLTAEQIQTIRATAASIGLYSETRTKQTSSAPLRNWSTAIGILMALGVLGMSVGLIRSETAADLRTLAATGASSTTRRKITGATSGALALLGATLGTAGAYAAMLVWYRSDLSPLARVPVINLALILVGLPVLAAAGGWLLAGSEPPTISRQPIH